MTSLNRLNQSQTTDNIHHYLQIIRSCETHKLSKTVKRAIIVEDEIRSLNNLRNLLGKNCPDIEIVGMAGTIAEAEDLFDDPELKPDVAFLDISLPDGLIFKLLEQLRPLDFDVIFVTAFDEYTKQACKFSSIDYILKPIDPEELRDAVSRVRAKGKEDINERMDVFQSMYRHPNIFEKMSISALDGIYFVSIREILRFEAEDNYTHIFLQDGSKITASKTIKSYEDMLADMNFYRVHKRHVINMNYMKKFVKGDGGYLVMDDNERIEVSRRRRTAFMEELRRLEARSGQVSRVNG